MLGISTWAAGWKVRTNPLSYGGTLLYSIWSYYIFTAIGNSPYEYFLLDKVNRAVASNTGWSRSFLSNNNLLVTVKKLWTLPKPRNGQDSNGMFYTIKIPSLHSSEQSPRHVFQFTISYSVAFWLCTSLKTFSCLHKCSKMYLGTSNVRIFK